MGCCNNKGNSATQITQHRKKLKLKVADCPNIKEVEIALRKGKNLNGKTVQFKVAKLEPQRAFDCNIETGKLLNFVSPKNQM